MPETTDHSSLETEVLKFYRQLGRSAGQKLNEDEIKTSRFLESALGGSDLHRQVAIEITMTRPSTIKPGSTGAYLYGCLGNQDGVDLTCIPSCLQGFQLPDQTPCQVPVWVCDDFGLTKLNNVEGDTIYVFSQRKLTRDERRLLVKDGVKAAIRLVQDDKGYRKLPVNLSKISDVETQTSAPVHSEDHTDDSQDKLPWGIILLIVVAVLIIIIIGLSVAWFKFHDRDDSVSKTQT